WSLLFAARRRVGMAFQMRGPKVPQTNGSPRNSRGPAQKAVLSERWFGQARFTQRLERGFVLQHEGWSATPSARSGGLDDVDGGPDGRVYIQMCRIEQVRIRSARQGSGCAALIPLIALVDVRQHRRLVDIAALRMVFGRAAAGTYFGCRGHVNLNVSIGTDDGAYISTIEYRTRWLGGTIALEGNQGGAHLGNG